jgi:hypothetical protein
VLVPRMTTYLSSSGAHNQSHVKTTHFHPAALCRRRSSQSAAACACAIQLLEVTGIKAKEGSGRTLDRAAPTPFVVNQTKRAIVAVMQQLGSPVSSAELQKIWAEPKALDIFEYHLSTLVKAKVVEAAYGPELHFRLVRGA